MANTKYDNYMNTIEKDSVIEFEGNEYIFVRYDGDYMLCENNEYFTINDFYEDLEFGDNRKYKMWAKLDYAEKTKAPLSPTQKYRIEESEYKKRLEKREEALKKVAERVKKQPRVIFMNHLRTFVKASEITPEMEMKEEEFFI